MSCQPNTYKVKLRFKWYLSNCIAFLSSKKTNTDFWLNSMLPITYRMPNITRGPERAMLLTQTFLPFNPNQLVLDQSLPFLVKFVQFLAFPLYSNFDSGRRSKLKNASTKWLSHWGLVELNRRIILPLQDDTSCPSVVIICSDSWIFCLFICTPLSLFYSPRHDSRRRSLFMRGLSHFDTHHLSGVYGRVRVTRNLDPTLLPCSCRISLNCRQLLLNHLCCFSGRWL